MISYETRLGKINLSETYLSKLIGNEVVSCFGVVGMVPSNSKQRIFSKFSKEEIEVICKESKNTTIWIYQNILRMRG